MNTTGTIQKQQSAYRVQGRDDGSLLVRVASRPVGGIDLPDAVFTFRPGDPQFEQWRERLQQQRLEEA